MTDDGRDGVMLGSILGLRDALIKIVNRCMSEGVDALRDEEVDGLM